MQLLTSCNVCHLQGFDQMIEASKSGLPVDLAQVLPILDEIVCDILMV